MPTLDMPRTPPLAPASAVPRWVLPAYVAAIFTSAALLFVVQPMFSKLVLPLLGGSAQVWTTCLLWFQTALLLGYLYAHLAPRLLGIRRHAPLHVVLCLLALLTLPFGVDAGDAPSGTANPAWWLLGTLTLTLGAPFVLLSSTGPLLQRWFSETDHPDAANPYFLYAASNAGSFIALLGYPLAVEPALTLVSQRGGWAWGYAAFAALLGLCAVALWKSPRRFDASAAAAEADAAAPTWRDRWRWIALAAVPSSLMMAVTTFMTTDLAPVPLLWVLPLALYLLTFVVVFARRRVLSPSLVLRLEAVTIVAVATLLLLPNVPMTAWLLLLHLATFFLVALACHGELARTRPAAAHLTEFYLLMSAGGALGGLFNALVAPQVFDTILEYPIVLVAACLVRPAAASGGARAARLRVELAVVAALALAVTAMLVADGPSMPAALRWSVPLDVKVVAIGVLALLALRLQPARVPFAAAIALLLLAGEAERRLNRPARFAERNFFGPREVRDDPAKRLRYLQHGTTQHGVQSLLPEERSQAIGYYYPAGPVGDVFRALRAEDAPQRVAVVGLGNGGLSAYARAGDRWTFYEIDPDMERLARDTAHFTFLAGADAPARVVLGDGRLALAAERDAAFDLLILDAFSSDAIPVHLVTREALRLYLRKLSPGGMLVFHVSNRYLDVTPVLARLAGDLGLAARVKVWSPDAAQVARGVYPTTWVVLAREPGDLAALAHAPGWNPPVGREGVGAWTDDYSNLFRILRLR